jgi:hypothetical protein
MTIFRAIILATGKNAAGIKVPAAIVDQLGAGKKPAVVVTLNGFSYRSSIASMDGSFMISVSQDTRAKSGLEAGQEVEVQLEVDTQPRVLELTPEIQQALDQHPQAKERYQSLSYSKQRWLMEPIMAIKGEETRTNRIARAIQQLHDGQI